MSVSDGACDQVWGTCMELKSDPQFVATSAGPGCAWEGAAYATRLASNNTSPGIGQQEAQGTPRFAPTCQLPVRLSL